MRVVLVISALGFALSMAGCGSGDKRNYDFTYNNCDTKEHSFDSFQAYCEGLRSNTLNQGCAENLRREAYLRECGSTFTTTN